MQRPRMLNKIGQLVRWVRQVRHPPMAVLRYHRVADLETDPFGLAVAVRQFEQHLALIRAEYAPVPMTVFDRPDQIPRRAVVLTFDDGYHDFAATVQPLLGRYQVPATVFVTTEALPEPREFWWDRVGRVCLAPGVLPSRLELRRRANQAIRFDLAGSERYTAPDAERFRSWSLGSEEDPTGRHRLLRTLFSALQPLDATERDDLTSQLERWTGVPVGPPVARRLGAEELVALSRDPLIEIGGHSVTHPHFRRIDRAGQWQEISECKASLDRLLRRPTRSFAYQSGAAGGAAALARQAGFTMAFTTTEAVVRGWHGRFRLPRIRAVEDPDHFARRLRRLVGG